MTEREALTLDLIRLYRAHMHLRELLARRAPRPVLEEASRACMEIEHCIALNGDELEACAAELNLKKAALNTELGVCTPATAALMEATKERI